MKLPKIPIIAPNSNVESVIEQTLLSAANQQYKYVLKTQLNPTTDKINKGISLFTAIKNREETFEEALKTWVVHEQIDEIIVVDWSSDSSLLPIVNKYQNGKILLAEVKNQEKWVQTHAFNLAARLTTKDKILKVDADIKVLSGFFEKNILQPGKFFTGDWKKARNENEKHLNGSSFLYREDFFKVNGYNEFFKSYGWDDSDLFARLEATGLEHLCFDFDTLHHIEHSGRMDFESPSNKLIKPTDEEWSNLSIITTRFVAKELENWSGKNKMLEFKFDIVDGNTLICKQSGDDSNIVHEELIHECEINAIGERLFQLGLDLPEDIAEKISSEEYIAIYNLYLLKGASSPAGQLFKLFSRFTNTYAADNKQKDIDINSLTKDITKKDQAIQLKEKFIRERDQVIERQEQDIAAINQLVNQKDQTILKRNQEIKDKEILIQAKDSTIQKKKKEVFAKIEIISDREQAILRRDQVILDNVKLIQIRNQLLIEKYQILQGEG